MTDTTLQLTEAFNRHNSLYNALLGNLKTLTTSHAEEITITIDARHARALTRILNATPLDGNPLNTRVNVETDTDAWETDASKINRYLEDNDWEPTLENVAAAFLYTETEPPNLDIELQRKEYRVTRIHAVEQYTGDGGGRAGKTDPAKELHKAFTSAFPAAPGTLNTNTKTDTLTKNDRTPEVITYVTTTANTSTAGAYYMTEILNQLSTENG